VVITSEKIFNIHKNKIKRKMEIKLLDGVSKNMEGKKPEFTMHFSSEYDYRFNTEK
jgi:hypothetical protein